jgi:hypothetical protein
MKEFVSVVLSQADASITQNGIITDAGFVVAISGQAVLTGSPVGNLKFQASDDFLQRNQVPTNWSDIPGTTVAVSAAGSFLLPKIDVCYNRIRLVYVPTSGTGTVSANIKTLGF